ETAVNAGAVAGSHRDEFIEAGERGVRRRFIFGRQVRAIDPSRAKAEGSRAHDVPAVRRSEDDLAGRDLEALGHERIRLGTRLVEADCVDRENSIEVAADASRLDGGGEPVWRAVRQHPGGVAPPLETPPNPH